MVKYRTEKNIKFTNLDGKSEEYFLKEDERLIDIKCPLDQTFLIRSLVNVGPENEVLIKCPKCGLDYDNHDLSPKNLQYQLDSYLDSFQTRITKIEKERLYSEKERSHLIKLLDFAKSRS